MSKTSTDLVRHALNGPTMGTRWTALFFAPQGFEAETVRRALQEAVDEVDGQMSTWKPESDLMRFNRTAVGQWFAAPPRLLEVIRLGLAVGRASGGAFDIGMGDAVTAWGFGAETANLEAIRAALGARAPVHTVLEVEPGRLRKLASIVLDLNGIAKGYGVDRLSQTLERLGIVSALVGIDGELRATGLQPDGEPWAIGVEAPHHGHRAIHSILALQDAAVATSGDYRHWVEFHGHRLSHTMDPRRGSPLAESAASVTVVGPSCAEADAWATALMVLGVNEGLSIAERIGLAAMVMLRCEDGSMTTRSAGKLFTIAS